MRVEKIKIWIVSGLLLLVFSPLHAAADYEKARKELIELLEEDVRSTEAYIGKSEFDSQVMDAMTRVPRHLFVPKRYRGDAYRNSPLPIGHGQTISQPYIVALMTDLLELKQGDRVLEVGTGSGYQAAILAELSDEVYTIEIIEPLAKTASKVLEDQKYINIQTRVGDGYYGWLEAAPFDAIVVTAAADHIPPPLVRQLKAGGRMVIPVGSRFMVQQLVLIKKDSEGLISLQQILPVRFVPLTGEHEEQ
jgi:protein-L-isoaspartate(D-aspartate) O-methyltransferase